ncbi:cupin domain-containing protein [Amaricoccus sp.]|uniref:cupin domain-containing protein n=1 Tax=Amaricoccus sp. TaxID=1872485 RepID=UPI0026188871|nr:cupin domain-containing protein [Amaricoccus sp.]HRO12788.1 cupin domain-containing protein [Amaricoccus sp.]
MSAPVRSFPTIDTGGGIMRRVLSESPEIMLVEVSFPAGAVGEEHSHPHVQSTLVKSGRFEFTVAGESFTVGPGDAFVIPAGAAHGCRALGEPGVLIDTFAPRRDDFL